jgi:hypothetical protein
MLGKIFKLDYSRNITSSKANQVLIIKGIINYILKQVKNYLSAMNRLPFIHGVTE